MDSYAYDKSICTLKLAPRFLFSCSRFPQNPLQTPTYGSLTLEPICALPRRPHRQKGGWSLRGARSLCTLCVERCGLLVWGPKSVLSQQGGEQVACLGSRWFTKLNRSANLGVHMECCAYQDSICTSKLALRLPGNELHRSCAKIAFL